MGKYFTRFVCSHCGYETIKWLGKCPDCGEWNTFAEELREKKAVFSGHKNTAVSLNSISQTDVERISTGMQEFNRVLGGGLVPGSLVLLGGDPGIGKSTLLLQIAEYIAGQGKRVLYSSGEESLNQIRLRSLRLQVENNNIFILNEQSLETIEKNIYDLNPDLIIIDSIQTVFLDNVSSIPGSVTQLRECTAQIMHMAKQTNKVFLLVGHVTKDGVIAGPKILEHMVDVVIYFEGEKNYSYRLLRGIKNRFGSTDEIGLLEMTAQGLLEIKNPADIFLHERDNLVSGSAVVISFEGSRPFLVEVQSLVVTSGATYPRRMASGIDQNRLALIIAVLEKKCGFSLAAYDVYLKITGGLFLKDPSVDLGIAAAIISSLREQVLPPATAFVGELALSGEIRPVPFLGARIKEALKMGFRNLVTAYGIKEKDKYALDHLKIVEIHNINELIGRVLEG